MELDDEVADFLGKPHNDRRGSSAREKRHSMIGIRGSLDHCRSFKQFYTHIQSQTSTNAGNPLFLSAADIANAALRNRNTRENYVVRREEVSFVNVTGGRNQFEALCMRIARPIAK
jgi:hypothetical protein